MFTFKDFSILIDEEAFGLDRDILSKALAKENITKMEVLDFEDLGMEAVRKITVKDFPAFIVIDDKGNDFFFGKSRGPEAE